MRHEGLHSTYDREIKQPERDPYTPREIKKIVVFTAGFAQTVLGYPYRKIKRDGVISFVSGLGDDYRDLKKWTDRKL
ncbi:hypothetical protein ACFLZH_00695 [Patescibacteria group bacterium]